MMEIKKCPFCGGYSEILTLKIPHLINPNEYYYYVRCSICKSISNLFDADFKARNAWNMRIVNNDER